MPDLGLSERRILHAEGMRASLRLLLEDPALDAHPYARAVVHDHFERCEAMIAGLESKERGQSSEQRNSERYADLRRTYQQRPLTSAEADEYRLLWLLAGIDRVKDHAGQFSGSELARQLGLDGRQIGTRLRGLVQRGYIRAVGVKGVWTTAGCRS